MVSLFLKSITTKWLMLFFGKNLHPYTVVLSSRILSSLIFNHSPSLERFKESFGVLRKLLSSYSHFLQVYPSIICIFTGHDISDVPIDSEFSLNFFKSLLRFKNVGCPEIILVISGMVRQNTLYLIEAERVEEKAQIGIL